MCLPITVTVDPPIIHQKLFHCSAPLGLNTPVATVTICVTVKEIVKGDIQGKLFRGREKILNFMNNLCFPIMHNSSVCTVYLYIFDSIYTYHWFRSFWFCGVNGSGAGPLGQSSSTVIWSQISLISLDPQRQPEQHFPCLHYSVYQHPGQCETDKNYDSMS